MGRSASERKIKIDPCNAKTEMDGCAEDKGWRGSEVEEGGKGPRGEISSFSLLGQSDRRLKRI